MSASTHSFLLLACLFYSQKQHFMFAVLRILVYRKILTKRMQSLNDWHPLQLVTSYLYFSSLFSPEPLLPPADDGCRLEWLYELCRSVKNYFYFFILLLRFLWHCQKLSYTGHTLGRYCVQMHNIDTNKQCILCTPYMFVYNDAMHAPFRRMSHLLIFRSDNRVHVTPYFSPYGASDDGEYDRSRLSHM